MDKNEIDEKDLERKAALETLRTSYHMYKNSIAEMKEVRENKTDKNGNRVYSDESIKKTLQLMNTMQKDVKNKFLALGGTEEELEAPLKKGKGSRRGLLDAVKEKKLTEDEKKKSLRYLKEAEKYAEVLNKWNEENTKQAKMVNENMSEIPEDEQDVIETPHPKNIIGNDAQSVTEKYDNTERDEEMSDILTPKTVKPLNNANSRVPSGINKAYDSVTLPSGGECYPDKVDKINVAHLVAYDENLILSPNLYVNGTFLDHILKNKIMDPIDPDSLVQGDRDAIIIWLRAGAYGPLYPVKMVDEATGKQYETNVDLSELKFKKFNLKGDENGYFDFVLPNSGDIVKFRFLTAGDAKTLERLHKSEKTLETVNKVKDNIREIRSFIENSDKFSESESESILRNLDKVEDAIYSEYEDARDSDFTHDLTNRLILSTVSVNGETNRKFISNYVMNMSIKDASEYRKYIVENEPGIDYNVKVKRPDSLGGGYVDTFLQLDQFIFIY